MMLQEVPLKNTLYFAIQEKKDEMFTLGHLYGLGDVRTIQCSQELDELLNQHLLHSMLLKKEVSTPKENKDLYFTSPSLSHEELEPNTY